MLHHQESKIFSRHLPYFVFQRLAQCPCFFVHVKKLLFSRSDDEHFLLFLWLVRSLRSSSIFSNKYRSALFSLLSSLSLSSIVGSQRRGVVVFFPTKKKKLDRMKALQALIRLSPCKITKKGCDYRISPIIIKLKRTKPKHTRIFELLYYG